MNSLELMRREMADAPSIFQPSQIWAELTQSHGDQFAELVNFKRDINTFFSNRWIGTKDSKEFKHIEKLTENLSRTGLIQLTDDTGHFPNKEVAAIYTEYVYLLNLYARSKDPHGILQQIEEPIAGNPILIKWDGKRISQDLAVNYMDFLGITKTFPVNKIGTILEIGGGYGCLASLFARVENAPKYWMVDIPTSLYVAQEYLKLIFPTKKVFEYRHFDDFSEIENEAKEADFCFFTSNQIALLPKQSIDVAVGINCFGDMPEYQIKNYLQILSSVSKVVIYLRNEISKNVF
jgi:putative sugar O-methyltransferase